jgi:hypothetical protein
MLQLKIDNYDRMRSRPQRDSAWVKIRKGASMCAPRADTLLRPYKTKLGTNRHSPVSNSAIARSAVRNGQESVAAPIPSPGRNK